jgi:uncharacterized protein YgbK (DUF1537 family)
VADALTPLLGCVADDFTGATDLALTLQRGGMRTVQMIGVPAPDAPAPDADAIVVALKSRTVSAADAVRWSLDAAGWLRARGVRQLFFKYCSTFDSTPAGNIGPVADALMTFADCPFTIACPAFPTNRRHVFMGRLFAGGVPLDESPMRDHPLTPMRDSDLVRVLQAQTTRRVGLVDFAVVDQGAAALARAFEQAAAAGMAIAIVDALTDRHLVAIGEAMAGRSLITGGSGVALGLPGVFRAAGLLPPRAETRFVVPSGRGAVLAGSCSAATREQVRRFIAAGWPAVRVDPGTLGADPATAGRALAAWGLGQDPGAPFLIYSTAEPDAVRAAQAATPDVSQRLEAVLAETAAALVDGGVRRLVVAGGETSGAVVERLGVRALSIGPEIAPGVPWTLGDAPALALALKSGNFGGPDFFQDAFTALDRGAP